METQITQIAVTPYGNGSATTGKTDLVYTLRLSPKKIADTEVCAYPLLSSCPLFRVAGRTSLLYIGFKDAVGAQEDIADTEVAHILLLLFPLFLQPAFVRKCWRLLPQMVAGSQIFMPSVIPSVS